MQSKILLLVGGGHAHALFLERWKKGNVSDTRLIVIDPHPKVPYTGMLPGFVAGHYDVDDLYINLKALTDAAGGEYIQERAVSIDADNNTVSVASGEKYSYDVLSVDVGIHSSINSIPGFGDHAVGAKPLTTYAQKWDEMCTGVASVEKKACNIAVIGGGVAGVELTLAMRYRLQELGIDNSYITIIDRGSALDKVGVRTKNFLLKKLQSANIHLKENVNVATIKSDAIVLQSGEEVTSDFTLGATGPQPYTWIQETGLPCTHGYINVGSTLQTEDYHNIFAVGDCAHFLPQPLVKAGVYAVREAPILHQNIVALLEGRELKHFKPQSDYLKLISLGEKSAAADKFGIMLHGKWLWQLKHHIDTSFMEKLRV